MLNSPVVSKSGIVWVVLVAIIVLDMRCDGLEYLWLIFLGGLS
jgi:hypothetical protein